MGLELIQVLILEEAIQANGKMIYNMEKELKNGKMTVIMKVNSYLVKRVV